VQQQHCPDTLLLGQATAEVASKVVLLRRACASKSAPLTRQLLQHWQCSGERPLFCAQLGPCRCPYWLRDTLLVRNIVYNLISVPDAKLQHYRSCDSYVPNKALSWQTSQRHEQHAITNDQQRAARSSEYHWCYANNSLQEDCCAGR
jgi:hypothetical protein